MNVSTDPPILDTLNSDGHLTKKSELDTSKADLLALEVSHFDTQFSHQKMVNVRTTGSRKAAG